MICIINATKIIVQDDIFIMVRHWQDHHKNEPIRIIIKLLTIVMDYKIIMKMSCKLHCLIQAVIVDQAVARTNKFIKEGLWHSSE